MIVQNLTIVTAPGASDPQGSAGVGGTGVKTGSNVAGPLRSSSINRESAGVARKAPVALIETSAATVRRLLLDNRQVVGSRITINFAAGNMEPRTYRYKSPRHPVVVVASFVVADSSEEPPAATRDACTDTNDLASNFSKRTVFPGKTYADVGVQTDDPGTVELTPSLVTTVAVSSVYMYHSPPKAPTSHLPVTTTSDCTLEKRAPWRFQRRQVVDRMSPSVCPDVLAVHIASRCAFDTVVDPFCGVGRIAVRLARTCRRVIAVDVDPAKIEAARRNAEAHGVADKIDFRVGDSFTILSGVKATAVVTSPPWAAASWVRNRRFDVDDVCGRQRGGLTGVLRMAHQIAPRVVLHLPKTVHMSRTVEVSRDENFGRVEFEDVSISGWKNSANTVLYLKSRSGNGGEPPEPIVSEVTLDPPQKSLPSKVTC